jgi:hypothetical protein
LGKINLSELNQLPINDRAVIGKLKRLKKKADEKPKLKIKKHVDKKVSLHGNPNAAKLTATNKKPFADKRPLQIECFTDP